MVSIQTIAASVPVGPLYGHHPLFSSENNKTTAHYWASGVSPAPQFGFMGTVMNTIANAGPWAKADMMRELFLTDFLGMCLPRTALEWKERGPQMAIETAIREFSGLVSLVFLSGWMGLAFGKLITRALPALSFQSSLFPNSPRVDLLKHHVPANELTYLANTFGQVLEKSESKTVKALQHDFYAHVLGAMESNLTGSGYAKAFQEQLGNTIGLQSISGKLTEQEVTSTTDRLIKAAAQRQATPKNAPLWKELISDLTGTLASGKGISIDSRLSHAGSTPGLLSKRVHVGSGASQLKERITSEFLEHLTTFWDRIVSPAVFHDPAQASLIENSTKLTKPFIQSATERLFGQAKYIQPTSWFRRLFAPGPQAGFFRNLLHAKTWVAMIPLVTASIMSMGVAFVNNYLTRKRNKGQEFFPGMVGPDGKPIGLNQSANGYAKLTPIGVFQVFERLRTPAVSITAANNASPSAESLGSQPMMIREVIA